MSRIEKGAQASAQIEAMRGEVLQTIRRRDRTPAVGCALAALAALLVAAALASWLVTATGIAAVPGFSRAYRAPVPDHAVAPGETIETAVSRALSAALTARLREGAGELKDRHISLTIPESAFTASLRAALAGTDQAVVDAGRAQAAVVEGALELFLPLKDNPQGSAVRLLVSFELDAGALVPVVSGVRLGALGVPDAITQAAFEPAVRQSLAPFARELGRYASLTAVSFVPGALSLEADLTVEVLQTR